MKPGVVLAYSACALIWGTTYFAIRVCIAQDGYATYLAAALRFAIAGALLLGLYAGGMFSPGPRPGRERRWVCAAGLLNAVAYALVYTAEESITGGLAAVIFGTLPLVTALVTGLLGVERASRAAVLGALISLCGIAIISWDRLEVSVAQAGGVAMMLGAVLMCTLYNIVLKKQARQAHPLAANAVFLASTGVWLSLLAVAVERRPPPWPLPHAPTLALLYLALIGSVAAFAGYFYLLKRVRLMTLSTLVLVQPVVALGVDAVWEHERIVARTYLGAAITLFGVLVNLTLSPRK